MPPTKPASNTEHSVQRMENSSYDTDFGVLTREFLAYDPVAGVLVRVKANSQGELIVSTEGGEQAVNVQVNSGDANIEYIGKAPIGSLTSAEVWQIKKIDITTGTVITWADGDDSFNNEFDNRESLSYS